MAWPSNSIHSPPLGANTFDKTSAELGQLLSRMQQTVLHANPEREQRLRRNEYERARLESNLDYARNSLSKLEQDAQGMLAPGRRAEAQADLNNKRELLELLLDRLQDLHKMAVDDDEDDGSGGEDILAYIGATPSQNTDPALPNVEEVHETRTTVLDTSKPEHTATAGQAVPTPAQPPSSIAEVSATKDRSSETPTQTSQTLRSRTNEPSETASSDSQPTYATARAALFANRRRPEAAVATTETSTATAEAILDQQAAEREDLADKVFKMAQAMKRQQHSIAASLDTEKDVLSRATEGMERAGWGMDAAKGSMKTLTKMTEGVGWLGRMGLYAWVYGLMLMLVLLVFVFPKLRF